MPDTLHCPFCGAELRTSMLDEPVAWYCPNRCIGTYEPKVWRALITGKKAQRQLRTAKDRCVKKIKAKEREIANYLNGISVRDKEIQNLREQLQTTQDALKVATDCIENIGDTWRGDIRWTNDDMDEIRINTERYCDSVLKKIKGAKK